MLKCTKCRRELPEKEALVHMNENKGREIICPECFQKNMQALTTRLLPTGRKVPNKPFGL